MNVLLSVLGFLFRLLLPVLMESLEEQHEAIEIDVDPDIAERFRNAERL